MKTEKYPLTPPPLSAIAAALPPHLAANYASSSVTVTPCPDLRNEPFNLTTRGLGGSPRVAEVGGQSNLFPQPQLQQIWSLPDLAREMEMSPHRGNLIGAGAGPWKDVGQNSELAADYSWSDGGEGGGDDHDDQEQQKQGTTNDKNGSRCVLVNKSSGEVEVHKAPAPNCALMCNLFGSHGEAGDVLKITARGRTGERGSFTECIQAALHEAFGGDTTVSLGGVVLIKKGKAKYHVMPDFPADKDLPFKNLDRLMQWLTWHEYEGPIIGLSVLHSADPGGKIGLRLEHTHTFSPTGKGAGGHYHFDLKETNGEDVEYEAYFNAAEVIYRIDRVAQRNKA
ncbi:uncharacterized protein B0I36DRAFT_324872 [Microdochium trichocladiopsis]|uniref:DUF1907 domain-containing protein n=1 Tax=Microdochium trichocladiopsis TaxID=1682393 RepID=A0A9P8Y4R5_9PEZI|nr:uncharacterized protein B0I36DRAFT_324872 [Microdochium trichocladiopsis]KAH7029025.1 hypothetical protein B0I36DRAFT_324872 [Microdochium trichocladiopsis]